MTPPAGTVLEIALNGPWSRAKQPRMPITPEEIIADGIACAALGAAVIHVHVYDPATGRQFEDADSYARVIEGIRAVHDVIVYPTLPLNGSPDAPGGMTPERRFETVARLAERGLLEWTVIDPGSTHFLDRTDIAADRPGFLYDNPEADTRHGLALAAAHSIHPSYAIYEPGFLRGGAALAARFADLPTPIYRLMFSDGFTFGFPPRRYALDAYHALLQEVVPAAPWMIAGLQVDIRPLIGPTLAKGGHVRVGLEDAPFGSAWSNMDWTEAALQDIARHGGHALSPADLRASLARRA